MSTNRKSDSFYYYVAFPALVLVLCALSYYLGWSRGKQFQLAQPMLQNSESTANSQAVSTSNLSFYKTLRETSFQKDFSAAKGTQRKPNFAIQLSAFKDAGKADELVDQIKNQGYLAKVRASEGKETWYRVFVESFETKEAATEAMKKIADRGLGKGFVVETKQ